MTNTNTNAKKFIILETNGYISQLFDYLEWYVNTNLSVEYKYEPLTKSLVRRIIVKLIEAQVFARCKFKYVDLSLDEIILSNIIEDWKQLKSKKQKEIKNQFTLKTTPNLYDEIEKDVSRYVEYETYKTWDVVSYGSIIGLLEGEDHRILEWHRLTETEIDDSILTLDYSNLVSYLVDDLGNALMYGTMHGKGIDPEILHYIKQHPTTVVSGLICDTLSTVYPSVKFEIPKSFALISPDVFTTVAIAIAGTGYRDHIVKVINAFTMTHLAGRLDKSKSYILNTTHPIDNSTEVKAWILSIYEAEPVDPTEQQEIELARSLINGDHLPESERRLAEQYLHKHQHILGVYHF